MKEIHDFHLWALSDEKPVFTAHIVCSGEPSQSLFVITQLLQIDYDIHHSTIQIEPVKESHYTNNTVGLLKCVNEHKFPKQNNGAKDNDANDLA